VYKAIQVGDKRKATSLQRLILKSTSKSNGSTSSNTTERWEKDIGVDGKASLKHEERLELIEEMVPKVATGNTRSLEIPIPKDGTIRT